MSRRNGISLLFLTVLVSFNTSFSMSNELHFGPKDGSACSQPFSRNDPPEGRDYGSYKFFGSVCTNVSPMKCVTTYNNISFEGAKKIFYDFPICIELEWRRSNGIAGSRRYRSRQLD